MVAVCRALGIPCRPVTGYDAAHDSQGSLTIDIIMDEEGNTMDEFTRDSVWNYHVWNEVRSKCNDKDNINSKLYKEKKQFYGLSM